MRERRKEWGEGKKGGERRYPHPFLLWENLQLSPPASLHFHAPLPCCVYTGSVHFVCPFNQARVSQVLNPSQSGKNDSVFAGAGPRLSGATHAARDSSFCVRMWWHCLQKATAVYDGRYGLGIGMAAPSFRPAQRGAFGKVTVATLLLGDTLCTQQLSSHALLETAHIHGPETTEKLCVMWHSEQSHSEVRVISRSFADSRQQDRWQAQNTASLSCPLWWSDKKGVSL